MCIDVNLKVIPAAAHFAVYSSKRFYNHTFSPNNHFIHYQCKNIFINDTFVFGFKNLNRY